MSDSGAENYERAVASFFVPWAADLVDRADLRAGWRMLDLACGTGVVSRMAGPVLGASGSIVASDLNEGMLAEARRHAVEGAPVEWYQADAEQLPFDDGEFDAVLCHHGLQFVPDKARAVREARRVLRPGGIAAVSVWRSLDHNPYLAALAAGLAEHVSAGAGEAMAAPSSFGDRGELADLFTDAGFTAVQIDVVTLDREPVDPVAAIEGNLAALPMAEQIRAMDPVRQTRLVDDIVQSLDEHISEAGLTAPNSAHVAIAR